MLTKLCRYRCQRTIEHEIARDMAGNKERFLFLAHFHCLNITNIAESLTNESSNNIDWLSVIKAQYDLNNNTMFAEIPLKITIH